MSVKMFVFGEDKDFVGIGKILIDTSSASWNIPTLHFLVEKNKTLYESVCLEFGLVASGKSHEAAAENIVKHTLSYIAAVMNEGRGYEEFKDAAKNGFMSEFWNAYRFIEFSLAEEKSDLSHEVEGRITRAIQEYLREKIKEIISVKAQKAADEALKEYERMTAFTLNSVAYVPLKEAA